MKECSISYQKTSQRTKGNIKVLKMNRPICEKIGDWHRHSFPSMKECCNCKSEKCPIQALIRSVQFNLTLIKSWHGGKNANV